MLIDRRTLGLTIASTSAIATRIFRAVRELLRDRLSRSRESSLSIDAHSRIRSRAVMRSVAAAALAIERGLDEGCGGKVRLHVSFQSSLPTGDGLELASSGGLCLTHRRIIAHRAPE